VPSKHPKHPPSKERQAVAAARRAREHQRHGDERDRAERDTDAEGEDLANRLAIGQRLDCRTDLNASPHVVGGRALRSGATTVLTAQALIPRSG
jgi:hypothetical protein